MTLCHWISPSNVSELKHPTGGKLGANPVCFKNQELSHGRCSVCHSVVSTLGLAVDVSALRSLRTCARLQTVKQPSPRECQNGRPAARRDLVRASSAKGGRRKVARHAEQTKDRRLFVGLRWPVKCTSDLLSGPALHPESAPWIPLVQLSLPTQTPLIGSDDPTISSNSDDRSISSRRVMFC